MSTAASRARRALEQRRGAAADEPRSPAPLPVEALVMALQRSAGNQAVAGVLQRKVQVGKGTWLKANAKLPDVPDPVKADYSRSGSQGPTGSVADLPKKQQPDRTPYVEFLIPEKKNETEIERGILDVVSGQIYITAHYDVGSIVWLSGAPGGLVANWTAKAQTYCTHLRNMT